MPDDMERATLLIEAWRERCVGATLRQLDRPGTLICDDCEGEIPAARRKAHPSATRCVKCQEQMEVRRGR
jgi:phage/conjugal plasmid C-4 type zinc finger TraR family protein